MDVAQYFASIDQQRLMIKISEVIDDPHILELFERIICSHESSLEKGLPLGNLTSQILGNFVPP